MVSWLLSDLEYLDMQFTYNPKLVSSYLKPGSVWSPKEAGVEPLADNFLMNGQHTWNCSVESTTYKSSVAPFLNHDPPSPCPGGSLYSTAVRLNETARLRLINHSSFMSFWFSIDNHTISIVEIDGVEVEPIVQRGVYINIGQRYSVLVTANQTAGNYAIRATLPQTCFNPFCPYRSSGLEDIGYAVTGILSYEGTSLNEPLIGLAGNTSNPFGVENNILRGDVWEGCDDMPFDMPVPMRKIKAIDAVPENTHSIIFHFQQAGEVNRVFINRVSHLPLSFQTVPYFLTRNGRHPGLPIVMMPKSGDL